MENKNLMPQVAQPVNRITPDNCLPNSQTCQKKHWQAVPLLVIVPVSSPQMLRHELVMNTFVPMLGTMQSRLD